MIPKPLNEIEWSDLEALRDSGREEDDTIEFKASFSGGGDFLSFNDKQQAVAVDAVAKEAIAFLNGRGGDVVIGAIELKNDHPRIESFSPIAEVTTVADRLAQALAATIEPAQSILTVRAIASPSGDGSGVIIVRAQSSLRAPHRARRAKECYIRRGRESVPMPMDEIQDLTLRRSTTRNERLRLLDDQFLDLASSSAGRHQLEAHRIHFRSSFVPFARTQIRLSDEVLGALGGGDPNLKFGEKVEQNNVAFRGLPSQGFRPILRGMTRENLIERAWGDEDFFYSSKTIREDGILTTNFACRCALTETNDSRLGLHNAWVAGYFANTLTSMAQVLRLCPVLSQGILRVVIHAAGSLTIGEGESHWIEHKVWPPETVAIPDFEIDGVQSLLEAFRQLQIDVASIAGFRNPRILDFAEEP